jgi:outer membrane lipoprotein-sorting protein
MTKRIFLGLCVFVMLYAVSALAQEAKTDTLTVDEIVKRANLAAYYRGRDGRADIVMTITDAQGRIRTREFTILRLNEPNPSAKEDDMPDENYAGDQKFYVYFHRPADVNKMAFMVWKHTAEGQDDDRWLYLPALDLVKRIAASDERTSFVGSDFFYEDVSGRNVTEDVHELVKTTDNYYVLKNTPRKPDLVEFSYYEMWIHRATFLPVSVVYYDRNGEKYREYKALKVEKIQGYDTVTKAQMSDLRTKGGTIVEYSNVKYDIGLTDDIFTERYLRRPPREYLR